MKPNAIANIASLILALSCLSSQARSPFTLTLNNGLTFPPQGTNLLYYPDVNDDVSGSWWTWDARHFDPTTDPWWTNWFDRFGNPYAYGKWTVVSNLTLLCTNYAATLGFQSGPTPGGPWTNDWFYMTNWVSSDSDGNLSNTVAAFYTSDGQLIAVCETSAWAAQLGSGDPAILSQSWSAGVLSSNFCFTAGSGRLIGSRYWRIVGVDFTQYTDSQGQPLALTKLPDVTVTNSVIDPVYQEAYNEVTAPHPMFGWPVVLFIVVCLCFIIWVGYKCYKGTQTCGKIIQTRYDPENPYDSQSNTNAPPSQYSQGN